MVRGGGRLVGGVEPFEQGASGQCDKKGREIDQYRRADRRPIKARLGCRRTVVVTVAAVVVVLYVNMLLTLRA